MEPEKNLPAPKLTEEVRNDILEYIDDRRNLYLYGVMGFGSCFTLGLVRLFAAGYFGKLMQKEEQLAEAFPTAFVIFSLLLLCAAGSLAAGAYRGYFGSRSVLNDLREKRYEVVRFKVCGKEAHRLPRPAYILIGADGGRYHCTSYRHYRDAENGSFVYGVRCMNGWCIVPRWFSEAAQDRWG